ncbi:MAG: hypothetical protein M3083_02745 [Actinomycetota bacterium]|nr:hypothetical protein [Actinomycetota bacterium]
MSPHDLTAVALGWRSHCGWAVLVGIGGSLIDPIVVHRERVVLLDGSLPRQPYHAAVDDRLSADEAAELVSRVERAAGAAATTALDAVAAKLSQSGRRVVAVGVAAGGRRIPSELSMILASHPLLHAAEGDLYEQALIEASANAGLAVTTLAPKTIFLDAACELSLTVADLGAALTATGKRAGPPWQKDHREATAVALVALSGKAV